MMAPLKVAVLDDYQGLSIPYFAQLDPAKYEVVQLKDTLPPYNHPSTTDSIRDELVSRLSPFEILCSMRERTPFPEQLISRLPNLRLFLTTGNRNRALDLAAFAARSIPVAGTDDPARNMKGPSGTDSTTQHCIALILSVCRNVAGDDAAVKAGLWQTSLATGVAGKVLGILGLGRLGAHVARIMATAFGMKVVAWSPNLTQERADEKAREMGLPVEDASTGAKTFKAVTREELFASSDVLSVHIVLSDNTRGLVTTEDLVRMKPTAFLVNTSRGPLIREADLLARLQQGRIAGAALDVFELEPLPADSAWRTADWGTGGRSRVVLTPHMGYVDAEPLGKYYQQQIENIGRWERGEELAMVLK